MCRKSMRMKARRKNSGHLLAEVMLAVLMLAVCALIFSATLPSAHKSRAKADNYNIATSLASKMMEEVRHTGYQNANATALLANGLIDSSTPVATDTYSWTNVDLGVVDSPGSTLTNGTATIKISSLAAELIEVTTVVRWSESGQTKTVTLSALLANI